MFFRGQIIGKYKILATIGSGGFGTVYLALDTWIDKKVALKVPHKQSVDFGELLREPRLLASLNHPNIVTILTAEKQENVFFIVMEFVPGETLEPIIAREGALDLGARARLHVPDLQRASITRTGTACCTAICGRRTCSSPANGLLKVADFGTSRFLEIAAHGTTVIGSPPYMAPEQFHGKAVFASRHLLARRDDVSDADGRRFPTPRPSPADLDRLMRGDLAVAPAAEEPEDPEGHQRHRAEGDRAGHSRAVPARERIARRRARGARRPAPEDAAGGGLPRRTSPLGDVQDIQSRLKAREAPQPRFCWQCRKPLHARSDRCPFCGEAQ